MKGIFPPSHCSPPFGKCSSGNSDTEPLLIIHNSILAHAKAVKLYRHHFQVGQGGMIGMVASAYMYKPITDDEADIKAAARALTFHVAWLLDPLVYGDYPTEMREYHGKKLPKFSPEESKLIKNSIDFIGLNHYSTLLVKDCLLSNCTCNMNDNNNPTCSHGENRAILGFLLTAGQNEDGAFVGDPMGMPGLYVVPQGIEEIVDYIKKRYNNMPIFVTENGYASIDKQEEGYELVKDIKRIKYHKAYLASLARSISSLSNVVSHTTSDTALAILLYSASAELLDTVFCFFDFHEIKELPYFTKKPDTDFLILGHEAQSASQYTLNMLLLLLLSRIPIPGTLLMYLSLLHPMRLLRTL
ncbi:beta-glucosidase 16 [Nicotiana attenuata]|uniref:Beta-glucosidase 16 n=1 Tax=Nicotiana attenuata TaxID=49451 RepID=A0A314KVT1_NICAT|nr:beta-glucosidase 16 [Nicotiana attenuata]